MSHSRFHHVQACTQACMAKSLRQAYDYWQDQPDNSHRTVTYSVPRNNAPHNLYCSNPRAQTQRIMQHSIHLVHRQHTGYTPLQREQVDFLGSSCVGVLDAEHQNTQSYKPMTDQQPFYGSRRSNRKVGQLNRTAVLPACICWNALASRSANSILEVQDSVQRNKSGTELTLSSARTNSRQAYNAKLARMSILKLLV